MLERTLSVAPMMDRTDRHCRFLLRLLCPNTLLYTEMISTNALIHGKAAGFLQHRADQPCALQLGGSNPADLATCAAMAEAAGYSEVNLNLGCPSRKVHAARIGASLMLEADLVAECVRAMRSAVSIPVTVKCRTGVDDCDSYEFLAGFVRTLADAGCDVFVVHARKALLGRLSPRDNRSIPPLHYDFVFRLKAENPHLTIVLNGGLVAREQVEQALTRVDGVMVGREAYRNPLFMAELDAAFCRRTSRLPDRFEVARQYLDYMEEALQEGVPLGLMVRHMQGLFLGVPRARHYRIAVAAAVAGNAHTLEPIRQAVQGLARQEIQEPC